MFRKTALLILLLATLCSPAYSQGAVVDFLLSGLQTMSNGGALSGGKVYSYTAGTTNAKLLYTDKALTTAATNPLILDTDGRAVVYGSGLYKFIVKDQYDVTIFTADNVEINGISSILDDPIDPFGTTLTQTNLAVTNETIASATIANLVVTSGVVLNGLSANNTKITSVATATARTDAVNLGQIQDFAFGANPISIGSATLTATNSTLVFNYPIDTTYLKLNGWDAVGYNSDQLILGNATTTRTLLAGVANIQSGTPASSTASGTVGDVSYDANYLYICPVTDTWMRIASSSTAW